ncbi:MAG: hypothetical protein M2R45_03948 [Verrucomicrobia subdivision 3 bacterium]|nr:hypothetical protein [Limisphaerales bacterium]MCS1415532.1 hypothetical protein [Limisphaerales bacterium]
MDNIIAVATRLVTRSQKTLANTRLIGAYRPSTLIGFEQDCPIELQSIFKNPFQEDQRIPVPTPILNGFCEVLRELTATN